MLFELLVRRNDGVSFRSAFIRCFCGWLILFGCVLNSCATWQPAAVPKVEDYLPTRAEGAAVPTFSSAGSGQTVGSSDTDASPAGLTLGACVRIALKRNPAIRAAQHTVTAAGEAVGEARAPYYPDLGLSAGYSRFQRHVFLPSGLTVPGRTVPSIVGPTDDWMSSLRTRLTLFDSGERHAQLEAVKARKGATAEQEANVKQDVIFRVHQNFYRLAAAREALVVVRATLARAEDHLRLAQERKDAGAVPKVDVIRAQVEVANSRLAAVRAESLVMVVRGDLNTIMGLPVDQTLEVDVLSGDQTSPDMVYISQALQQAVHARPALKAALQRVAAAQRSVDGVKSAYGPKIKAEAGYGWQDSKFLPKDEEWYAGVFVEWPLFTGFYRWHHVNRSKAELSREEADLEQAILAVSQEVWSAHAKWRETGEAVQTAAEALRGAEESLRLTRERYAVGAGTLSDLLDAQNVLARAQTTLVETQWDHRIARSAFQRAVGAIDAGEMP
jgi:outer membrane protein